MNFLEICGLIFWVLIAISLLVYFAIAKGAKYESNMEDILKQRNKLTENDNK